MPARPGLESYWADETAYHDELVNDGGRPAYPISLLKDVSTNPTKYGAMVSIWHTDKGDWRVFRTQLKKWKNFRVWQKDNRDINEDDAEWEAHVESEKRFLARRGVRGVEHVADTIGRAHWQGKRDTRRDDVREPDAVDLPTYVAAVKSRLAYHDFTVPPQFQLDQDPKRQDIVTTWIEYLCFAYWWVDSQRSYLREHQPKYDYYWTKLKESGLLRPSETEDYIWAFINAQAHRLELDAVQGEAERAAAALEQLKGDQPGSPVKDDEPGSPVKDDEPGSPVKGDEPGSPVKGDEPGSPVNGDESGSQQKGDEPSSLLKDIEPSPNLVPIPIPPEHALLLRAAQNRYDEAMKCLWFVERRQELFRDLEDNGRNYRDGKVILDQVERVAGWVLDQVQLLMAEANGQDTLPKAEKRKRGAQDKKGPSPKKRKVEKQQDKRDGNGVPLRRSARIAAIQAKRGG